MTVAWITVDDVVGFLGADTVDEADAWLIQATATANQWCYDQRAVAGYLDSESTAPNERCVSAAVQFAAMEFRRRGAIDGYQGDVALGGFTPSTGLTLRNIRRLLGVPKPLAVA